MVRVGACHNQTKQPPVTDPCAFRCSLHLHHLTPPSHLSNCTLTVPPFPRLPLTRPIQLKSSRKPRVFHTRASAIHTDHIGIRSIRGMSTVHSEDWTRLTEARRGFIGWLKLVLFFSCIFSCSKCIKCMKRDCRLRFCWAHCESPTLDIQYSTTVLFVFYFCKHCCSLGLIFTICFITMSFCMIFKWPENWKLNVWNTGGFLVFVILWSKCFREWKRSIAPV